MGRRKHGVLCACLSALLVYPLVNGAGTFESSSNASTFPRIYNASESSDDWLGYSCASIGGKGMFCVHPVAQIQWSWRSYRFCCDEHVFRPWLHRVLTSDVHDLGKQTSRCRRNIGEEPHIVGACKSTPYQILFACMYEDKACFNQWYKFYAPTLAFPNNGYHQPA